MTGYLFVSDYSNIGPAASKKERHSAVRLQIDRLIRLQSMANYLQASDFQDAIIDAIIETLIRFRSKSFSCRAAFGVTRVAEVYDHSSANSLMRKFVTDYNLRVMSVKVFTTFEFRKSHPEHLADLFEAALPYLTSKKDEERHDPVNLAKSCDYHEHTLRGELCYKVKYRYLADKPDAGGTYKLDTAHR